MIYHEHDMHNKTQPWYNVLRYFVFLHLILFKYHLFTFKYTNPILFKAQEYLCLEIFEKPMIQIHGKAILSMEIKSIIKAHDSSPWQFIHPKPNSYWQYQKLNSHWQHQSPILIGNIKAQFLSATSKPNSYWQHQNPIFIGTTLSKRKKPKIINAWQRKNIMLKCYRGKKGP